MSNKHPKTDKPSDRDLRGNPGIGTSKGAYAREPADPEEVADGENTFEGDVENDTTPQGGLDERQTGRTNR